MILNHSFLALRKIIFLFFIFIIFSISYGHAEENSEVRNFVQSTIDKTVNIINDNIKDEQKKIILKNLFVKIVDLDLMGRFAIGKNWNKLTKNQQEHYLKAYSNYMLESYVPRFRQYNGQKIQILAIKNTMSSPYYIVDLELKTDNTIKISYKCKKYDNGEIKIIDIIGNGVSLLNSQRSDFSSILEKNDLDTFITLLENKNTNEQ